MVGLLGGRGASAVMGLFMLALASSEAGAQNLDALTRPAVAAATIAVKPVAATTAVTIGNGTVLQAQPARSVTLSLNAKPSIVTEAAWLRGAGWGLAALADRYGVDQALDEQASCMAIAVYHEARGESVEGQLAVARVIMNRAASGKYPATWCEVVKQPWQFSFVNPRTGHMPGVDAASDAWRKAVGVTRIAIANAFPSLSNDVLWYHANYVAPSWGRRLSRVQQIGAHIFYRA